VSQYRLALDWLQQRGHGLASQVPRQGRPSPRGAGGTRGCARCANCRHPQSLQSQVDGTAAQLRAAEIDLENTVVRAPGGGRLGEIGVRLGQCVTNGTQWLSLAPDDRWITANFKETQAGGVRPGLRAWITVDALGDRRIEGHVDDIAPATASEFSFVKPDNGTGNFVKIPQGIGVRLRLDGPAEASRSLRRGMPVAAQVDAGGAQ
jgi:multidrug resistance efflux pump